MQANNQLQAMRQKRIKLLQNILRRYDVFPPQSKTELQHQKTAQNELSQLLSK